LGNLRFDQHDVELRHGMHFLLMLNTLVSITQSSSKINCRSSTSEKVVVFVKNTQIHFCK
jgi:hypothetical protein